MIESCLDLSIPWPERSPVPKMRLLTVMLLQLALLLSPSSGSESESGRVCGAFYPAGHFDGLGATLRPTLSHSCSSGFIFNGWIEDLETSVLLGMVCFIWKHRFRGLLKHYRSLRGGGQLEIVPSLRA